jgi:FixJ family two-component response regulator
VQSFSSAHEFLACRPSAEIACLVLDVQLPGKSGLDLQEELNREDPLLPVVFLTGHGDIAMSVRAMKAGAVEFLSKPFHDQDVLDAVGQALERARESWRARAELTDLKAWEDSLTPREREVMGFVLGGLLNKQIAFELGLSEVTIKIHRRHVMCKMHADSLADLLRKAALLKISPTFAAVS